MSDHGRAAEATVVWWIQPFKDSDVRARLRQPGTLRRVLWRCLESGDSGHLDIATTGHWIDQADVTGRVAQSAALYASATIQHVDSIAHLLDPATRLAPMLPRDLADRYGLDVLAGIAIDEGTPSRRHVIVERCLPPAMHPRLAQWACARSQPSTSKTTPVASQTVGPGPHPLAATGPPQAVTTSRHHLTASAHPAAPRGRGCRPR